MSTTIQEQPTLEQRAKAVRRYAALEGLELFVGALRALWNEERPTTPFDLLGDTGNLLDDALDAPLETVASETDRLFDELRIEDQTPEALRAGAASYLVASRLCLSLVEAEQRFHFLSGRAAYLAMRAQELLQKAEHPEESDDVR